MIAQDNPSPDPVVTHSEENNRGSCNAVGPVGGPQPVVNFMALRISLLTLVGHREWKRRETNERKNP